MLCENFNCSKEAIFSCLFSPQLKTLLYWLMSHLFLNNLKGIPSMIYDIPPPEEDRSKRIGFRNLVSEIEIQEKTHHV